VVHRRDSFRASHILAQRVLENDKITVLWNKTVEKFVGEDKVIPGHSQEDADEVINLLTHIVIRDVNSNELSNVNCSASFVAIGHKPNTDFVKNNLDMDNHGYLVVRPHSTYTTIEGVFAAGDVADKVYRQAITSAGSGAMAALDAERWLSEQGIGDEAAEFEAELLREMLEEQAQKAENEPESAYPELQKKKETSASREKKDERKATAAKKASETVNEENAGIDEEEEVVVEEDEDIEVKTEL